MTKFSWATLIIYEIKKCNEWIHPKSKPGKRKWAFIFSDSAQVKVPFILILIMWDATASGTNEVISCQALFVPSAADGLLRGSKRFTYCVTDDIYGGKYLLLFCLHHQLSIRSI